MSEFYFLTTATNFLICYDKYSNTYDKSKQVKSKYNDKFYLLKEGDVSYDDLSKILNKLSDRINKSESSLDFIVKIYIDLKSDIYKNDESGDGTKTNVGHYIDGVIVSTKSFHKINNGVQVDVYPEDILALAYKTQSESLMEYDKLKPRTLSYLPVKIECQASCKFCFSKSSISLNKRLEPLEHGKLDRACALSKERGAERFVITGGGEPLLFGYDGIIDILKVASKYYNNILIITNGKEIEDYSDSQMDALKVNGLERIAVSIHSDNLEQNKNIMRLDVDYKKVFHKIRKAGLKTRLICVLQKGGIDNQERILDYIKFSIENKINEICFKELYVSTNIESDYHNSKANVYSSNNRVSLSIVTNTMDELQAKKIIELPWGSPVYLLKHTAGDVRIAAYTEPSVGWERTNGIARSWNLMFDHKCYASLESDESLIF